MIKSSSSISSTILKLTKIYQNDLKSTLIQRCMTSTAAGGGIGLGGGKLHDQMVTSCNKDDQELFRLIPHPRTLSVLGAPMMFGQPFVGTDTSPMLLRESGLLNDLTSLGWRVNDLHDLDLSTLVTSSNLSNDINTVASNGSNNGHYARNSIQVGQGCYLLAKKVESIIDNKQFPLILGGDHSIGIGSLPAMLQSKPDIGVIWVDAHADLNTPATSLSGNMHGMSVALNMDGINYDCSTLNGLEWLENYPKLTPDSIVYIGLRDVDVAEREFIRRLGIQYYSMYHIDKYGIGTVMEKSISHLLSKNPNRPIFASVDIDAVDPIHAPATGTAVRGGLTYREMLFIAEYLCEVGNLIGLELVELNPQLCSDVDGVTDTIELGKLIITSFLGKSII